MEAYENFTYEIGDNLYINLTSKCTNACTFCVRNEKADYFGHKLWLSREPSAEEVLSRIPADIARYKECSAGSASRPCASKPCSKSRRRSKRGRRG